MFKPQPGKDAEDVELDEVIQKTMERKDHLFPGYCTPILKPQYVMRYCINTI